MVTILPRAQITELRNLLSTSKKVLFFYDSDPDGLCSFLLLHRYLKALGTENKGIIVKTTSHLDRNWVRQIDQYQPDTVIILDMPVVDQSFIDGSKVPVYWIDHHTPQDKQNVHYYNPRIKKSDAYIPTTRIAYEITKKARPDDMWIAAVGCVADWYVPDFKKELMKKYPSLMDSSVKDPETALFESPAGRLARIFSFVLKGKTNHCLKCVAQLAKIQHPDELFQSSSSEARIVLKHSSIVEKKYNELLSQAKAQKSKNNFFVFTYEENQWSFSSDLSNEIAHLFPDKVTLVCREKNGEYKCSLRSRKKPIAGVLRQALVGINGRGGGHEYACGAVIAREDFERFLDAFKREYEKE